MSWLLWRAAGSGARCAAAVGLLQFTGTEAQAQPAVVPISEEFVLNELTSGDQHAATVVSTSSGTYLASWTSKKTIQDHERVYLRATTCAGGVGLTDALVQATDVEASSGGSLLAHTAAGVLAIWSENFLVKFNDTRDYSVVTQGFSNYGKPVGDTFRPSADMQGNEFEPAIAPTPAGDFVLAWQDFNVEPGETNQASRIRWQRVDVHGHASSEIVDVAPYSSEGLPINPSVAAFPNGEFALVWQELGKDGDGDGIVLKRFTGEGDAIEPEVIVNSTTTDAQEHPTILAGPGNRLFAVWESEEQDGSGTGLYGQLFDDGGGRIGGEFRINQQTVDSQETPRLTPVPGLGLLVNWRSRGQDGDGYGAFARGYSWSGSPLGDEFQLNTTTSGDQQEQTTAADLLGNILAVWSSPQDGEKRGVIGRFFATTNPVCGDARVPAGCRRIASTDALAILRASVEESPCSPCVCDTDSSGSVGASDALAVLRVAVGLPGLLNCPVCETLN